jgi:glycosyltransferase involved in cell wall biosynthesis
LLFITHRLFFQGRPKLGGADLLVAKLSETMHVDAIEHDLHASMPSIYSDYISGDCYREIKIKASNTPIRWLEEIYRTVLEVKRMRYTYCLAADPLCGIISIILKKLNVCETVLFHAVDYSDNRFKSKIGSFFYVKAAQIVTKRALLTTVVSRRTLKRFLKFGAKSSQLMYFPNSRIFDPKKVYDEKQKDTIICMTSKHVSNQYDYLKLLKICFMLKEEGCRYQLRIFGNLIDDDFSQKLYSLVEELGLSREVRFMGYMRDQEYRDNISTCSIGVTFYRKEKTGFFGYYGDSLKIREYAAYGIPIISEDLYETAVEGKNEGCVLLCDTDEEYVKAFKYLMDENNNRRYKENCIRWAKATCKGLLLEEYGRLLSELEV